MTFILDKIKKNDINSLVEWFNDANLCKYMEDSDSEVQYSEKDILEMINNNSSDTHYYSFRYNNKIIGYASIYDINPKQRAEFSFLIGDSDYRGKGIGKIIVSELCNKAIQLNLNELYCTIFKENIPSIKTVINSGFIEYNFSPYKELQKKDNERFFLKKLC